MRLKINILKNKFKLNKKDNQLVKQIKVKNHQKKIKNNNVNNCLEKTLKDR